MNEDISIYIHIPFCKSKCYYCDFISFENKEDKCISTYIDAVCNEILQKADILSQYNIKTIYLGGGTPSFIDSKYIEKIISTLNLFKNNELKEYDGYKVYDKEETEITIEINPGTITKEKIKAYKRAGINRVSLGLQTTHDETLKKIGRKHTFEEFENALKLCKEENITNISVDLIYPLPGLTLDMFKESVNKIIDLKDIYNIKHISIYNLEVYSKTKLAFLLNENYLTLPDEDEEYQMRLFLEKTLAKNKFEKYEISNFSLKGFESKHNLNYWNQGIYLGFGIAASSYISSTRYTNGNDIKKYIEVMSLNTPYIVAKEEMDKLDLMKEYIILKLRLKEGLNSLDFKNKFKVDLLDIFKIEIDKLIEQKLIIKIPNTDNNSSMSIANFNICLTNRGFEVANVVFRTFV